MKARHVLISAILAISSSIAVAGQVTSVELILYKVGRCAQGDMFTARTSLNNFEFIGCGVRQFDDGAGNEFAFGFCQAGDADENQVTCFTQTESLLETMRSSAAYSFISFSFVDDGNGGFECTRIGFSNQSFYLPKK